MAVDPMQAWMLPLTAGWRASEAWLDALGQVMGEGAGSREPPPFASQSDVVLDLPTMRLRRFRLGKPPGKERHTPRPILIVAPYALHHAAIVDLAPGHSIVQRLAAEGLHDIWVTEWTSATPDMAGFSIDTYLAELLVAVDELGGAAHLVGLCQGGWLSLAFAARWPARVASLVLAGTPVDFTAAPSQLVDAAHATPPDVMHSLVAAGGGRALSQHLLAMWGVMALDETAMRTMLQLAAPPAPALATLLENWHGWAVDLPGRYLLDVIDRLFRHNELAEGEFRALGRSIDLSVVDMPLCVLVGRQDPIAPPGQALPVRRLVGTPLRRTMLIEADCGHLPLFLGAETLAGPWARIAHWLHEQH